MKIAILSDIHGNLPALEAVTADIQAWQPDRIIVDGDVVNPGEMPAMNYPAADGPSLRAVRMAMIHLAATGRVVAFSVSSWNPQLPGADLAAAAMLQLAQPFIAEV